MTDRWPGLLPKPTAQAIIREQAEDFEVEEIPAYLPSGQGDHLMLWLQKRALTSDQVIRELARHLEIAREQIGCAGMKDRWAVTRQWLSIPAAAAEKLESFELAGVEILETERHGNKLKTGHLRGNRFRIRIHHLDTEAISDVTERCQKLKHSGVPNYFGPQRFGRRGDNDAIGRELLLGKKKMRNRRNLRLMLSAAQSALFNDVLALRISRGLFSQTLAGDLLVKADSGGVFLCDEPETDQARLEQHLIHPSGPMFGPKMRAPEQQPAAMEQEVLAAAGLETSDFLRYKKLTRGTRRPLRFSPTDLAVEQDPQSITLSFTLPAGSYATSLLKELLLFSEPEPAQRQMAV